MDINIDRQLLAKARRGAAAVVRSPLGNALVAINAVLLVRSALLAYGLECDHVACVHVGDPVEYGCCFGPSASEFLYRLAHLPTYAAVGGIEWLLQPGWDRLCVATAYHVETALYLVLSCAQWLVLGACFEVGFARARERRRALAAGPPDPERPRFLFALPPNAAAFAIEDTRAVESIPSCRIEPSTGARVRTTGVLL